MDSEPEDFITVEEAAERLRIGRNRAYEEARLYIRSGGTEGIVPAIPVGRLYRVSVARLGQIAGGRLRSFHRLGKDAAAEPIIKDARSDDPADRPRKTDKRWPASGPQLFDT